MADIEHLKAQLQTSINATSGGVPQRTSNQFFGVGPITDMALNEVDARRLDFEFQAWLEKMYAKLDDKGNVIGCFTSAELSRSMHRGYPADKVLLDMMSNIHRYFEFPKSNKLAVGLGGGHSGFTVCALHLLNANDANQPIFVDTPKPETIAAQSGGFFRQSWGAQLIEMQRYALNGDEDRLHFADHEGGIPNVKELEQKQIKIFIGVGHETTGATSYTEQEIQNLLDWIDINPTDHHAVIDATSLLGAMPWRQKIIKAVMKKCIMFMPFQKAIGGVAGYFVVSLTPEAICLIDKNQNDLSWAIPRQLKITVPNDPGKPLSSQNSTSLGPLFEPQHQVMQGGIINTYSTLAFAETTFGLLRIEKRIGNVANLNKLSVENRALVNQWLNNSQLFDAGVEDEDKRGAAVTLLKVNDKDIVDDTTKEKILSRSKQLLGYEGITHNNGSYEKGLDVARYINAFPGTPGDYRAWIGGVRPQKDIVTLLDNIEYAYHRAKISVIEEQLAKMGESIPLSNSSTVLKRKDDSKRAYKVLIADLVGMRFDETGSPDFSETKAHIESRGEQFRLGKINDESSLEKGKIHFFYQPNLSYKEELLAETKNAQFDAVIAAATFLPQESSFPLGGVRIGAGTGNMGSNSWGGGNGIGGVAPLMNTPSFNSRATAQMAFKALLNVLPDLPVKQIHEKVVGGKFDTGKNLCEFPTEKLEGKRFAIIGYGNIGREVAKLAKAFGMQVVVYAREKRQRWIESEGFIYAKDLLTAACGADVISPHIGLGIKDPTTGLYANEGLIDSDVLYALNDGAVVINYDRGEVVNVDALATAMHIGKVKYAAIDADIFISESGEFTGSMLPYLQLDEQFPERLALLPHAAADTEHVSRVEGAIQAVDQLFDVIQYQKVVNGVGDFPDCYQKGGSYTVKGVGKVTIEGIEVAISDDSKLTRLRELSENIASIWGAIAATADVDRRSELLDIYGADLIENSNHYSSLLAELGLQGPFAEK